MKTISFALIGTILPLVHAIGNAIVTNNCPSTIYVWSVGSSIMNFQAVASKESYTERYRHDPVSGGIALKVTTIADGIYNGAPELDYAYNLDNHTIWYDISGVSGDPFAGYSVALVPSVGACRSFIWKDGKSPSGINTAPCSSKADMELTLC